MSDDRFIGEESAAASLWIAGTHYPSNMESFIAWVKEHYPHLFPTDPPPPQGDELGYITVVRPGRIRTIIGSQEYSGPVSLVNGGEIFFGVLKNNEGVSFLETDTLPRIGDYEIIAGFSDENYRMIDFTDINYTVMVNGSEVVLTSLDHTGPTPPIYPVMKLDGSDGPIQIFSHESYGSVIISITNRTPASAPNGHPQCREYDCVGSEAVDLSISFDDPVTLRWAEEMGFNSDGKVWNLMTGDDPNGVGRLRPGEGRVFEFNYAGGPFGLAVPQNYLGDQYYETFLDSGASQEFFFRILTLVDGMWDRRTSIGSNPRDFGDFLRDFEGPADSVFKSHNNEYDLAFGFLSAAMKIEEATSDPTYGDVVLEYMGRLCELSLMAHRHFMAVDTYAAEGSLQWLYRMPFQHVDHGGSGRGICHRAELDPNAGHTMGWGTLIAAEILGCPFLADEAAATKERMAWKIENGPGMPGLSETTGELRAPAQMLAWVMPRTALHDKTLAARVIEEAMARPYFQTGRPGEWRYKPWMLCLFMSQVARAARLGVPGAFEAYDKCRQLLEETGIVDTGDDHAHLYYQVSTIIGKPSNDNDMDGAFWSLLASNHVNNLGLRATLYTNGTHLRNYGFPQDKWPLLLSAAGGLLYF